jgi:hypothetical protein
MKDPCMLRYAWRTAPLAIVLLSACAGNGEGLDASGRPLTTGPEPLVAELKSIQDNVFTPICTACHVGAAAPLGFRLDASSTFAMLVNTPSVEVPSMLRVAPGNPDASYLIQKLEGHAAVGGQMPLGQPPLAQATIDVIRQWITDGAQASASATSLAGPVRMRAITPLPGESLSRPPADIVVAADGELDTSSIDSSTVLLVRSGGDGSPGDAKDAAKDAVIADVRVTVRSLNPTVLAFSRAGEQWAAGRYQLTIAGRERSVVTDRNGTAIDGAASGLAGSDFVLEFTVEASP